MGGFELSQTIVDQKVVQERHHIRIKRDYARHLKAAQGKSAATVDAALKAIARFEDDTGARDFKTFRREQAIAFKNRTRVDERLAQRRGSERFDPGRYAGRA